MQSYKPIDIDNLLNTFLKLKEEIRLLLEEGKLKKAFEIMEKGRIGTGLTSLPLSKGVLVEMRRQIVKTEFLMKIMNKNAIK